ncbi:ADP-ribosylation factor-binding protein GGA3a isoform X2 [Amphiprion ocellaris]|uniref:Golgi associated, gamma adaptin ear containing, ARF binding protein 3a n=1 Tax=Amphiprion ocellaris TaxID=80972 RepID=A0AAQ6AN68_AMPOC|nr:ADP-ribosylation factor-binding protein GGA3a isoform X2 [Amphiprion ocellaris]
MADDGESLESWLNKATNPSNRQEDWEYIMGFCDQINNELEGPQISIRLLAYKIQSPQEWEAMQALTVLEACMKNCGRRFHNEVGKFKFLNELIKVVSPKYLGDKVSEKVKKKVIELLYSWAVSLPDEAKICEAYQMLKSQGIVLADPEISLDATLIPSPSPRPSNPVFDDEKKSKRLAELLKSKKPEDLQEANRLIKNMVKEDEVRRQKATKQKSTLEAVNNSVRLLNEMLAHFSPEDSTDGDKELIRELYGDCDKLRQTVYQLVTESEDNDTSLGDLLQASDDLSHVINSYKKIVEGHAINGETEEAQQIQTSAKQGTRCTNQSEILIDLVGLDIQTPSPTEQQPPACSLPFPADLLCGSAVTDPQAQSLSTPSAAFSLLDEELLSLGLNEPAPVLSTSTQQNLSNNLPSLQNSSQDLGFLDTTLSTVPAFSTSSLFLDALSTTVASHQDLTLLDLGSANKSGVTSTTSSSLITGGMQGWSTPPPTKSQADDSPLLRSLSPILPLSQASPSRGPEVSLADVFVPLDAIKPSKVCPVTAYDKNGFRLLLHFATDCPPGRPDVLVMVASMLNTAPQPVRNIVLQVAVPRTMKVRLQPPSGTELASFNPILPPAAITQVMLLASPLKEKVRMRYKLTFMLGEQPITEVGEVNEFPPADKWGAL